MGDDCRDRFKNFGCRKELYSLRANQPVELGDRLLSSTVLRDTEKTDRASVACTQTMQEFLILLYLPLKESKAPSYVNA